MFNWEQMHGKVILIIDCESAATSKELHGWWFGHDSAGAGHPYFNIDRTEDHGTPSLNRDRH